MSPPSECTPYQTFDLLMDDFQTQISGFLHAHSVYIQHTLLQESQKTTVDPVYFGFVGEYSVIADPTGGEVATKIHLLKKAVEQVMDYQFR